MGGTILNVFTVVIGSLVGMVIGDRLPERMRGSVMVGIGAVTLFVGMDNASATGNVIIPLISIVIGVIIGELLRLDAALDGLAGWLQSRVQPAAPDAPDASDSRQRFITGFVTVSLIFCVGPLTILGSIQDGMGLPLGFQQLAIKSVLDGFSAVAFAATFGIGVLFSALTVLVVQGSLALFGALLGAFMSEPMIAEMTATGGLILLALSLVLLDIKRPPVANFLPALFVAPLIVFVASALGVPIYPVF